MKTQGEMEAAICQGMAKFELEYMGRGPQEINAYIIGDLLGIRLRGVFTAAERYLAQAMPPEKGRDLLKQVRTLLIEKARPELEAMILEITGVKTVSLHYDISTVAGEEVVIFSLKHAPVFRHGKRSNTPLSCV
jgi:uncharacterized protein YbcI